MRDAKRRRRLLHDAINVDRYITYAGMHLFDESDRIIAAIDDLFLVDGNVFAAVRLQQFRNKPLKCSIFALPFVAGRRDERLWWDNNCLVHDSDPVHFINDGRPHQTHYIAAITRQHKPEAPAREASASSLALRACSAVNFFLAFR